MLLWTHFWQVNSPARGGNDDGSGSPVVLSDWLMLPSVSLQYTSVWLQFDEFFGEQPSLSSTSSSGRFFWTSMGGKHVRWRDVKAVIAAVLQMTAVLHGSAHDGNHRFHHTAWNDLTKDEGDVQSAQISDKNSYCCNINPNFHQMQPWDIMCILLLWSITRSFSSHQQLVSGGASEERSIRLLLNLVIFFGGVIFWFLSFQHSLNNDTVPLFYFSDLVLSVLF